MTYADGNLQAMPLDLQLDLKSFDIAEDQKRYLGFLSYVKNMTKGSKFYIRFRSAVISSIPNSDVHDDVVRSLTFSVRFATGPFDFSSAGAPKLLGTVGLNRASAGISFDLTAGFSVSPNPGLSRSAVVR